MGTRGLLGHIIRGRKRASYNHFDSYPDGLGVAIVRFIKSLTEEQIQQMIQNLEKIEWIEEQSAPSEEARARYIAADFADLGVAGRSMEDWYCLLRNVQGAASLPYILDGTLVHQIDSTDFEEDSLFCEWVYYVDWEKKTVTVKGCENEAEKDFNELTEEWMRSINRKWMESED